MNYIFYYKVICIAAGVIIISLGYKLFVKGIFSASGDVEGRWKDLKIIISKAAPGTYFVLFGSAIIGFTVYQGFSIKEKEAGKISPSDPPGINAPKADSTTIWNMDTSKFFHH